MGLLSTMIFLPLFVGVICLFLGDQASRWAAMVTSLFVFVLSLVLWGAYDSARGGSWAATIQLVEGKPGNWISDLGIGYVVGVDGIAVLLIALTAMIVPIVVATSWSSIVGRVPFFMGSVLVLETGMIGAFAALDTFLFYVFWEIMLIPMIFIIGIWGGAERIYASVKFFIFTMAASLLMLIAILALYVVHHQQTGVWSAYLLDLYGTTIPYDAQRWMFAAFAIAFAVKVPMFPVHTWLPDAHVQAPTGGSVVLAAVLLKLGTFGFLRYAIPLFPAATVEFAPVLMGLGAVGVVYGALVAMAQTDIKKLVAYSSVSHMGAIMLGLFALNAVGMQGAVYQMIGHGLSTGALFLLVGMIYERRHTRQIAEFGGLARVVPVFSLVFVVVTFSSIGLPGLNGFVGEFLILLGAFERFPVATAIGATGVILGAVYMLGVVKRVVFGPLTNVHNASLPDLSRRELAILAPLLALIVAMGIAPQPFLDTMARSVEQVIAVIEPEAALVARVGGAR